MWFYNIDHITKLSFTLSQSFAFPAYQYEQHRKKSFTTFYFVCFFSIKFLFMYSRYISGASKANIRWREERKNSQSIIKHKHTTSVHVNSTHGVGEEVKVPHNSHLFLGGFYWLQCLRLEDAALAQKKYPKPCIKDDETRLSDLSHRTSIQYSQQYFRGSTHENLSQHFRALCASDSS